MSLKWSLEAKVSANKGFDSNGELVSLSVLECVSQKKSDYFQFWLIDSYVLEAHTVLEDEYSQGRTKGQNIGVANINVI